MHIDKTDRTAAIAWGSR